MKKFYEAPKLTNHGTVSSITEASTSGSPDDVVFGPNSQIIGTLTGSLDACTFSQQQCKANNLPQR